VGLVGVAGGLDAKFTDAWLVKVYKRFKGDVSKRYCYISSALTRARSISISSSSIYLFKS